MARALTALILVVATAMLVAACGSSEGGPVRFLVFGDPEEIRAFCQGQIAHYKIPRYVKLVDAFPMTVTGKIQKYLMREAMKEELGLVEAKTA